MAMAVLTWMGIDDRLTLEGDSVRLRPPRMGDFREWAELRQRSRAFLQPWEPTWPLDDLTRPAFRRRLALYGRDRDLGQGQAFFVFREEDGALVGGVNLRNIMRGVAQSAQIGYWAGQPYARLGYISAGVHTATRFAFRTLGLHRVEAACCTDNDASRRLLLKVGFQEEGIARGYLKINGKWRDHLLFGLIADEPAGR
jgi:[ribosomal protein S5]-alanine N-acetyltransferase